MFGLRELHDEHFDTATQLHCNSLNLLLCCFGKIQRDASMYALASDARARVEVHCCGRRERHDGQGALKEAGTTLLQPRAAHTVGVGTA
jgi:hypothetical protein